MTNTKPLNVTQEGNHRVFVGLGWDPNENLGLKDKALNALGLKDAQHDLDLSCYIYDSNKRYIGHVSIEEGREADQTGKIYHSGDNVAGVGDGDDEQISVELKDLDPAIHSLVFKASIKSGHRFNEVNAPEIRLVDAYSRRQFWHASLQKDGNTKPAFVFASITKNQNGGWVTRDISEFTDIPTDGAWADFLKDFA
ncbi:MAG: TerD family protein [Pseudomonadota bacterium]